MKRQGESNAVNDRAILGHGMMFFGLMRESVRYLGRNRARVSRELLIEYKEYQKNIE